MSSRSPIGPCSPFMSLPVDKGVGSRGVRRAALPPGPREGRGLARSPILDSFFSAHSNGAAVKWALGQLLSLSLRQCLP